MLGRWHTALAFATAMLWLLTAGAAMARQLDVGPTRTLKRPSQAAMVAAPGDVVRIGPGVYRDCAVWYPSHLTIEAAGPGVRLVGKTCADKGIFVIQGDDVTVRGLSFEKASVVWHNGAGIRFGGNNLTIEGSRFINNENGILAGGGPHSTLRIVNSTFIGNGVCNGPCAHGVYAGQPMLLLDVEHCVFRDTHVGHHIKSRALNTVIRDNRIEDGPDGNSSYLIDIPNGGNVLIEGNVMEKGPASENRGTAISIGAEGVKNPTHTLIVQHNLFRNDTGMTTVFVRNITAAPAILRDNHFTGSVTPLLGAGRVTAP